jgi:hypothetical protein
MSKQKLSIITLLIITLSMLSVTATQAQNIQDYAMCFGYGTVDLQPRGVGSTIFPYTEKIGLWVQIQNPPDTTYRVIWLDPNDSQFRNTAVTVIDKSGENWGIIFDSINIAETTAENKLGVWVVELYIDGELELRNEFQIIDLESIQEQIAEVIADKNDLIDDLDTLRAENEVLEAQISTLEASYAALEAQVGTQSDYEELQDNYDDLSADYDALEASQGSTRTMMYASIVVALIAVVVAVYFGLLKK